jgi:hypothetical protein
METGLILCFVFAGFCFLWWAVWLFCFSKEDREVKPNWPPYLTIIVFGGLGLLIAFIFMFGIPLYKTIERTGWDWNNERCGVYCR